MEEEEMEEEMYEAYQKLQEHEQECKYVRDMEIQKLHQELANSISISLIEKKREELENVLDIIKTGKDDFSKGQASVLERIIKMFDKELLDERNNIDER